MTGLIGCLRTLALPALTVCGVLVAQTGFDGGSVRTGSEAGAGLKARLSMEDAKSAVDTDANVSFEADTTADGVNECAVSCLAPCASACVPPASLSGEGDAELEAGLGAAFAPEHSCGCPERETTWDIGMGLEAEAEADSEFEVEATTEADGSLTAAVGNETNGAVTIELD